MPTWFYEGDREVRIAKAIEELEARCRRINPGRCEQDIRAFVEHQLPLIHDEDEENPRKRYRMRPNWVAEQPPTDIKYVLDAMWFEWYRAKVRWGEIIHALRDRYCTEKSFQ